MNARKALAAAAAFVALACTATPAAARDADPVPEQSGLTITVPASVALGAAAPHGNASAQLGTVRVSDNRGLGAKNWTASVTTTTFTTGTATALETIPKSAILYWSGPATITSGTGIFSPGQATANDAVTLDVQRTAFTRTGVSGNNSASWRPTVRVNVPDTAVSGTYTGRLTHTVL
ncbi:MULTISPECIES: hypothetical protein [Glycomyces]|uniref:WxL domain-containing protein n=2 Tax=Glycomyces TaxID=58113 RepID=A0ABU2ATF2_9ACTN|nr:hypothetical protein [Glycomyces lechevalierae]MDR7340491.1 hypothetical protein [Glycomyces lechevalierae]